MVWPGCSSTTAKSLNVSSNDGVAGDALAADDIVTYRGRQRTVYLNGLDHQRRRSKEGRRAVVKARVFFQHELKQAKASVEARFL
jgi:hypothetical protein